MSANLLVMITQRITLFLKLNMLFAIYENTLVFHGYPCLSEDLNSHQIVIRLQSHLQLLVCVYSLGREWEAPLLYVQIKGHSKGVDRLSEKNMHV